MNSKLDLTLCTSFIKLSNLVLTESMKALRNTFKVDCGLISLLLKVVFLIVTENKFTVCKVLDLCVISLLLKVVFLIVTGKNSLFVKY